MKPWLALIAVLPALWAAPQPPAGASDGAIEIEKIELLDVGMERVRLAVYPLVVPYQDAELAGITFFGLKLNDIPIFIPPVAETMRLQVGHRFALRQPLQVSIYYRDLSSLGPLVELVRSGKLHLEGNAVFEARLSLLPSLLLHSRTARAPMKFSVEVPITLPGNVLTQAAALQALQLVEPGSRVARDKIVALIDSTASRQAVMEHYGKGVFALARYALTDHDGKRYPLQVEGIAFRVDARRLVLPRELVEPWRFDSALVLQIKSKKLSVADGSYELLLWPNGADVADSSGALKAENAYSSLKNQFKIVTSGSNISERLVATVTGKSATLISVLQRASPANLAVVEFPADAPGAGIVPAIDRRPDPNGYTSLVAFRFGAGGWTEKADPEILSLSAKLVDGRLILDDPIDASAWGSPMISANGVVGILQDEKSGILFTSASDALKLNVTGRKAAP